MALADDLTERVNRLASTAWGAIANGRVVPETANLTLGNTGVRMNVCILYADVHRSTEMVNTLPDTLAASYYKAFLHCCAQIVRANDGVIEAYDGDRIMAIYTGDDQADRAVITALEIFHAVENIINPSFLAANLFQHRPLKHTVGIDLGPVLVAKTGAVRDSDLVWVGAAANYAAKLNSFAGLDANFPTRITPAVFNRLSPQWRNNLLEPLWDGPYVNYEGHPHYRSSWFKRF
jgi:class 3 adenylate cyclase